MTLKKLYDSTGKGFKGLVLGTLIGLGIGGISNYSRNMDNLEAEVRIPPGIRVVEPSQTPIIYDDSCQPKTLGLVYGPYMIPEQLPEPPSQIPGDINKPGQDLQQIGYVVPHLEPTKINVFQSQLGLEPKYAIQIPQPLVIYGNKSVTDQCATASLKLFIGKVGDYRYIYWENFNNSGNCLEIFDTSSSLELKMVDLTDSTSINPDSEKKPDFEKDRLEEITVTKYGVSRKRESRDINSSAEGRRIDRYFEKYNSFYNKFREYIRNDTIKNVKSNEDKREKDFNDDLKKQQGDLDSILLYTPSKK